jgi:nucleotide-binding universal stress UspA family protein
MNDLLNESLIDLPNKPLHFLVCVDAKKESETALRMACIKAVKRCGQIDILHVVEPSANETLFGVSDKIRIEKMNEAQNLLSKLTIIAEQITGIKPNVILQEGEIGETILKICANQPDINLIVLGVANGGTRGKLIAWLAAQLGEKLIMPMLLVPGNLTNQQLLEIS